MSENQTADLYKVQAALADARDTLDAMQQERAWHRERAARLSPAALGDRRFLHYNRLYSDLMALWRRCPKASCYRTGGCRGLPSLCVTRCASDVPARVREGATLMLHAVIDGVPQATLERAQPKLMAELDAWIKAHAR